MRNVCHTIEIFTRKNEKKIKLFPSFPVTITLAGTPKWIKFNRDQIGYYRVNYPDDMWTSLIGVLETELGVSFFFSLSEPNHET